MENWVIPLTLIPGIGLITMSTATLYSTLSQEISTLIHQPKQDTHLIKQKISEVLLINVALVALYLSTASFALTGLIGGVSALQHLMLHDGTTIFLVAGIGCLLVATVFLIAFSIRAVKIKHKQYLKSISKSS